MALRVLIADPDTYLVAWYAQHLGQQGYEVLGAVNGLECVAKLREAAPDVLVLDPSLPWGWGDGVLARMHEDADIPRVPVILLTYGSDWGLLYRLARFGVDDYQLKPLSASRLAERIRTVLRPHGPLPKRAHPDSMPAGLPRIAESPGSSYATGGRSP